MKSLRINFLMAMLAVLAVSQAGGGDLLAAPANNEPQILFLHLKLEHNKISMVNLATAPGVGKPSRMIQAGLQYEVISTTGESLWKGSVADPSERPFEYQDPPHSGRLQRKTIHFDYVEFTIRVPAISGAKQIDFHVLKPASSAKPENNLVRKTLGSVVLSPNQSTPP